jgi:hypothetical protein
MGICEERRAARMILPTSNFALFISGELGKCVNIISADQDLAIQSLSSVNH